MVTRRAAALGLLAGALLCAVTPYNDNKIGATNLAGNQFPVGALFVLFLLAIPINAFLRRFAARFILTRPELLTVWTLILVASGIPSSGLMRECTDDLRSNILACLAEHCLKPDMILIAENTACFVVSSRQLVIKIPERMLK